MNREDNKLRRVRQEEHIEMAHECRQSGRATNAAHERSSDRTGHGGLVVTLRIKPDRRCRVTHVDPANERRRR
jgi:hypothetical protein